MTTLTCNPINTSHYVKKFVSFKQDHLEEDSKFFHIEGLASTFGNSDLGDDVIVEGAFRETLLKRMPKFFFGHEIFKPTIGVFDTIFEDTVGLRFKGRLPKNDSFVSGRLAPQLAIGALDQMSIGFNVAENGSEIRVVDGKRLRFITKIDPLFDISIVTLAMNPKAEIDSFKKVNFSQFNHPKDISTYLTKNLGLTTIETNSLLSAFKRVHRNDDQYRNDKTQIKAIVDTLNAIR